MKKVLIISYKFPPDPFVGGLRIQGLAKYLPEFGWEAIILTTILQDSPDKQFRVIQTPYYDVISSWKKKFGLDPNRTLKAQGKIISNKKSLKNSVVQLALDYFQEIIAYPDAQKGWYNYAVKAGSEVLKNEDIDAMISSSSPVTSHRIARELKTEYKIPWVADFRDLWTQNHYYQYGPLRKWIERRLELKILLPADALVTVSQPWAEKLRVLHRGKATYTITNGFDPDKMSTGQIDLTSKFTITYTGLIYTRKQDPSKLLAALKDLISDGTMDSKDVEVKFYGSNNELLARKIEEYGLSAVVKQYGIVPREIAFKKQGESQLLLLLNWEDSQERGVYPGKIFEYLAVGRPILAIGGFGNDVIERLLGETKAGMYCKTVEDIKNILRGLYLEYKLTGKISYNGDIEKINKYSYREMARKFAGVLNSLT